MVDQPNKAEAPVAVNTPFSRDPAFSAPSAPQPAFQQPAPARPAHTPPSAGTTAMVTSEVERLLATGDRLLKNQQERVVQETAAYETTRTQLMNDYNAKVAKLDHDTQEALYQLHVEHEAKIADIKRLIAKLTAMREA